MKHGFGFQHVIGACMHCALWTRLDILTACLVPAQYQAAPGLLHFCVLKHLAGYLRRHPDLPMTFKLSTVAKDVAAINFVLIDPDLAAHVSSATYNPSHESDPEGFIILPENKLAPRVTALQ
jgi:hypothetical protein